ncbi:unnamed protein product [Rotaria sordida]|uniref:Testis-expressed sequence 2 protein n=1 Tax=Rotaria sordida TaxID=392033 RepID=A0A819MAJ4_9BILA|nr:unnamed protein product [Rotaria sordida]CAF3976298.1 unnamed protein product [Rotaria sordida]
MERVRRLFTKTNTYRRLSEIPSLSTFGNFANKNNNMITHNQDHSKKSSSVFEKLGQRINTIKEDIADNIERRKQSHINANNNQIHFITRPNQSEDSLTIEKKSSTPIEIRQRHASGDDNSTPERSFSTSQLTTTSTKKALNEPSSIPTTETILSNSFQDIFSTENSERAKDMIINNVRQGMNRSHSGVLNESSSDDYVIKKPDLIETTIKSNIINNDQNKRKFTMLLAGPKFRQHTIESQSNFKRDTIYPISFIVGIISIIIILWKPISPLLSGFILGFICASSIAYIIIRMYLNTKSNELNAHEWIDFPELESILQEKITKIDKYKSLPICCEIVFGQYDHDQDEQFIRYPVVMCLDNDHLIIQLPTRAKTEEKKDKEIRFVGHREYLIKDAKLILVPEATLSRIKYWVNDYPIVIQNTEILNKEITNKQNYEKSKFDVEEFFNNSQTTLSIFFETCPDKEDWFYKLLFASRKNKEEIEGPHCSLINSSPTFHSISSSSSDTHISTLSSRSISSKQSNKINTDNFKRKKSDESIGSSYSDIISLEKIQINEMDIINDMTQARIGAQELRTDILEKDKKQNDKDSDKDSSNLQRTGSLKKKFRKQQENLDRILNSSDCLNEAAITLNFLVRRLFCDIFQESLFKDLLKEKIELKLKELAVSVLEDLHVETIDMGNTFPIILKVEPMQWNNKGLWFNLFLFYRGSFKITIRTRIVLQRLLNTNTTSDPTMYYQHRSGQVVYKDDDNEDTVQKQKLLTKDPDIPENAAARKLGLILTKVAGNKHFQRFAALKPVAGVIEKLSNADVGAIIELMNFNGIMTINIPPPPSDRIWIGFSEMPDLNLKVTPVFGESKYSYTLIHDFLESQIRDEIKRLLVLPAMDDQLLPFFRDWVIDMMSDIATKTLNKNLNQANGVES